MRLSDNAIDVKKREEGDWVDSIPEFPGLRLKVRGAGNKDWRKRRDELIAAVPRHRRVSGLDNDDADRINIVLFVETGLIDWDGLEDEEGKPLPFSKEQAREYLSNPEYEPFRNAVSWACGIVAEKRRTETEADAKN